VKRRGVSGHAKTATTYKMKTITNYIVIVFATIGLVSCNSKPTTETKIQPTLKMTGQLYFFAPEMDTLKCQATGACDCCASHLLFLTDSEFVAVDYCLYDDCYYKGKYRIDGNKIAFQSDSIRVDRVTNEEAETDTTQSNLPPFYIMTSKYKTFKFNWTMFECNGTLAFKTDIKETPFATADNEGKENFIKTTKKDSIWLKLGLNN
jgi:hypothetical protein